MINGTPEYNDQNKLIKNRRDKRVINVRSEELREITKEEIKLVLSKKEEQESTGC